MNNQKISKESQDEAAKIARGTQKPGQTREQTKLIAQGIEKGIAEFKKKQKTKARDRDKFRKKELKIKKQHTEDTSDVSQSTLKTRVNWLPWSLLGVSWMFFFAYVLLLDSAL
jgi:hypothetical protein